MVFTDKMLKLYQVMINSFSKFSKNLEKGFTMVEMLITLGIFSMLTAVVMFQYGNFNSQTILTNMAYEVALATRQAQVYALGVRGQAGNDNFENRYGVYFDNLEDTVDEPGGKKFIFFIDQGVGSSDPLNSICDGTGESSNCFSCEEGSECLESYAFLRDISIDSICLSTQGEPLDDGICNGDSPEAATITFERPNPDAIIYNIDEDDLDYNSAAIFITNKYNDMRAVVIKSTGQISVEFID
jgi:prepilin-type N-terminal cleavage/methylation domain-containing protein